MIFRNGNINELLDYAKGKKLCFYGTDYSLGYFCDVFAPFALLERIDFAVSKEASGGAVQINGVEKPFVTLERLLEQGFPSHELVLVFIEPTDLLDVITSKSYGKLSGSAFYMGGFLLISPPAYDLPEYNPETDKPLISKMLHYCWFGKNPMPPIVRKCLESWKNYCPDYEIIEWNEDNYDIQENRFVKEAYQSKKWAYVSDYVRLDVVYRYGGVYLDADVELLKPIDRFLCTTAFCGLENPDMPALGLAFGSTAGNEVLRALRDMYKDMPFINDNGTFNDTINTYYHASAFRQLGLTKENSLQHVGGFTVYPTDVFSPVFANALYECFTENTHAIHHFMGSYHNKETMNKRIDFDNKLRKLLTRLHGGNLYRIPLN